MSDQPKVEVVKLCDYKHIEDIVKQRCGDKFLFAYFDDKKYYLYISADLWDRDLCYISAMIQQKVTTRIAED